ncbi:protein tyrosine phosphatase [uncultured Mucilaginibacter sp.]|uniref:low molecular weight protein tyrosine phosphatase family protein n=1 Tax=uncultured Mucilaginibacter sp. TaxID=797541 RepID=UPI0025FC8454|nr:protein tyrosine phosphatase [uncultured Mucilaginibacter sp.]
MPNLLFICSKNQWRSPTAEHLFKNHQVYEARSAGTSEKARIKVSAKLLAWADVVFVMGRKHKQLLQQRFAEVIIEKEVVVLDIEDNYQYNDPELVAYLSNALKPYLEDAD